MLAACEPAAVAEREWTPQDHTHPETADPARVPQAAPAAPEQGGAARAAQALFTVTCAGCHGRDGRGGGSELPPGIQAPDLTQPSLHESRTDAALASAIREGKGAMPGFGQRLNAEGIQALVQHIRSLKAAPAPSQPTP